MDEKAYIEYVFGGYSDVVDEDGRYTAYKKYYRELQAGALPFNPWAGLMCPLWFFYRRMVATGCLSLALMCLTSGYLSMLMPNISTVFIDIFILTGTFALFGKTSVGLHYAFLKQHPHIKKGPSEGAVIILFVVSLFPSVLSFPINFIIHNLIDHLSMDTVQKIDHIFESLSHLPSYTHHIFFVATILCVGYFLFRPLLKLSVPQ